MSSSYLPYQQFESCARELASLSDKIGDGWELKHIKICSEPEKVFLIKATSHSNLPEDTVETSESSDYDTELSDLADACKVEEPADPAVATEPIAFRSRMKSLQTVCIEYHIVYSDSYEVPILYFNATHANGRQLQLDDIWKMIPKELTSSNTDRWSLISQQEHPLLNRPFYHIHPCHTAKVMGKALPPESNGQHTPEASDMAMPGCGKPAETCDERPTNYLLSWLSMFGPLVGLKVPLAYASSGRVEE